MLWERIKSQKLGIFCTAVSIRLLLSYIFYGSFDINANLNIASYVLNNDIASFPLWIYFPVFGFYLWFCGLLSIKTVLPLAFCFKWIPCIFDALIAVLIFDIVSRTFAKHAFKLGMLYALCPVPIAVVCFHGQWDAVFLFFLILSFFIRDYFQPSYQTHFLFGLFFGFSFMVKPPAMVFLPFFFVPYTGLSQEFGTWWRAIQAIVIGSGLAVVAAFLCCKITRVDMSVFFSPWVFAALVIIGLLKLLFLWKTRLLQNFSKDFWHYLKLQTASMIGMLSIVVLCFVCFYAHGFDLIHLIDQILRYCNHGIQVFGLPYGYPFNQGLLALILGNRFWIMGVIAFIALYYYQRRIDVYNSLLISFALIIGFSGLCPQYLVWLMPFLLLCRWYKAAAVYGFLVTVFYALFYAHPLGNPVVPLQNILSFVPLKAFAWLMTPDLGQYEWLGAVIYVLGNYVVPACAIAIALYGLRTMVRQSTPIQVVNRLPYNACNGYNVFIFVFHLLIAITMLVVDNASFYRDFILIKAAKIMSYDVVMIASQWVGVFEHSSWVNIVYLLLLAAVGWGMYTAWLGCNEEQRY